MRPLAEIVKANRLAVELGIKTGAFKPVGTEPAAPALTPEEMKRLGLDQY
jgi:queuine/archaeosine tRNA-ribosyltransferase